eukprot:TRINITY_DN2720_c2_g1_i1.p1 TRINITY_DN2720_c2_g1~~TRINITY_DN2720_c2_g1_i1.p1  ORF type:complete len:161 (+),score=37.21 TRINITY_DN2720_c2_g1_i1:114-596(+)
MYKLLIQLLVQHKHFYQLHQFLQFHIVGDSVPVACQLLRISDTYPPAQQLALDMLKRLCSPNNIVEVLLIRKQLLPALKVIRNNKDINIPNLSYRFLDAAASIEDDNIIFFTVYKFFEQRNEITKNCKSFEKRFYDLFVNPEISENINPTDNLQTKYKFP